jgi:flagellar basal-body rod protein FlgF
MTDIFQIASIGMADSRQRLEAVSQNTANVRLPGYRRHVVSGSGFQSMIAAPELTSAVGRALAASTERTIGVNLEPAALMQTGRSLDVAVDAQDQFFALTDGTQTWLTRSGAFRLGNDGILVGEGGLRVVGTQGDIHLKDSEVAIGADGRIVSKGAVVGFLQLFRANDPKSISAAQGSLLAAASGIAPAADPHVRGGMLEASNSDSTHEMLETIVISRQFEAMSRVVQGYDDALGQAIQKLGEI